MTQDPTRQRIETLGPADRIIAALLAHADHLVHNRPGLIASDPTSVIGVKWDPATYKLEPVTPVPAGTPVPADAPKHKVAYRLTRQGKKTVNVRAGILGEDGQVREGARVVAQYRQPGLFPEVATWMWKQIADIWKLDNEFAAKWASYAFGEEHRDLKVALAAFMLVQSRRGDPVKDNGKVVFFDDDFRDVGEAMCLIRQNGKDLNPKLLLRIHDLLRLPQIAQMNRELGFGVSPRNPALGRWPKAVERWLSHREQNPKLLQGLVKAGFRTTVMDLARTTGYKPDTNQFFQILRWKQKQSGDGRRGVAIGQEVSAAETWEGFTEQQICQRIIETRPNWKRLTSLLPPTIGVTRAVVAAAVQAGALSDPDLIILTPTLEDLGLLTVEPVKTRWEAAVKNAENQRAANIATRVKKTETVEKLAEGTANAMKKAVEEVTKDIRIYVAVDISGSQSLAIVKSKDYLAKLLGGFPLERLHVATFNDVGRPIQIRHASAAGVDQAFKGVSAGGGTNHRAAIEVFKTFPPKPGEDVLILWVGDQQQTGTVTDAVRASGLNPVAFGFLYVPGTDGAFQQHVVGAAANLGIPCFPISEGIFNDPYSVTRTIRNLIASTPVGKPMGVVAQVPTRVSLVEAILGTKLLVKPTWAVVAPQQPGA